MPVFLVVGSSPIGGCAGVEMSERESEQLTSERYVYIRNTYVRKRKGVRIYVHLSTALCAEGRRTRGQSGGYRGTPGRYIARNGKRRGCDARRRKVIVAHGGVDEGVTLVRARTGAPTRDAIPKTWDAHA